MACDAMIGMMLVCYSSVVRADKAAKGVSLDAINAMLKEQLATQKEQARKQIAQLKDEMKKKDDTITRLVARSRTRAAVSEGAEPGQLLDLMQPPNTSRITHRALPAPTVVICLCGLARSFVMPALRANLRSRLVAVIRNAGFRVHAYLQTTASDSPRITDGLALPKLDSSWLQAAMAELDADRSGVDLTDPHESLRTNKQMARFKLCVHKWVRPLEADERGGMPVDFVVMTRPDIAFVDPVTPPRQWSRAGITVSRHNMVPGAPTTGISDFLMVAPGNLAKAVLVAFSRLKSQTRGDNYGAEKGFANYLQAAAREASQGTVVTIDQVDGFMTAVVRIKVGLAVTVDRIDCYRQRTPENASRCTGVLSPPLCGAGVLALNDSHLPCTALNLEKKVAPLPHLPLPQQHHAAGTSTRQQQRATAATSLPPRLTSVHPKTRSTGITQPNRQVQLRPTSVHPNSLSTGTSSSPNTRPPTLDMPTTRREARAGLSGTLRWERSRRLQQLSSSRPNTARSGPAPSGRLQGSSQDLAISDVALVVTGGLRTLATARVYENLRRTRTALAADLFLYLDPGQVRWASKIGYSEYAQCALHAKPEASADHVLQFEDLLKVLRPTAHAEFDDCHAFGSVPATYTTHNDNVWKSARPAVRPLNCTFRKYRRTYPQFIWAASAFKLLTTHEARHQPQRYTWIFKLRPDLIFSNPPKPLPHVPNVPTVFAPRYIPGSAMIIDWWALMTRDAAETYFTTAAHAFRRCDEIGYPKDTVCPPKLDARDVECLLTRHLLASGMNLDVRWASKVPTSLVHYGTGDVHAASWTSKGSIGG